MSAENKANTSIKTTDSLQFKSLYLHIFAVTNTQWIGAKIIVWHNFRGKKCEMKAFRFEIYLY